MGIAGFLGKSQELMLSDLRCYHHRAVDSCAAVQLYVVSVLQSD